MKNYVALLVAVVASSSASVARSSPVIFSEGLTTPESISRVPAGFGSLGGQYFVTDPGPTLLNSSNNTIWTIPANGGPATPFFQYTGSAFQGVLGGLFLPQHFGSVGGQFVFGADSYVVTLDSSAKPTLLADTSSLGYFSLATPAIAPHSFGSAGGNLFFASESGPTAPNFYGGVVEIDRAGNASVFAATPGLVPFGLAFAPHRFGSVGGDLLVSNATGNSIDAITPGGQVYYFATIPNVTAENGLRQIGFVPPGFGKLSGELLVSVSGSPTGGGQEGELYAVNSAGQVVAVFNHGNAPFDPRGFTFTRDGHILISDTTDPILSATPADFVPYSSVPELDPGALSAALAILTGATLIARDRRRSPRSA